MMILVQPAGLATKPLSCQLVPSLALCLAAHGPMIVLPVVKTPWVLQTSSNLLGMIEGRAGQGRAGQAGQGRAGQGRDRIS